MFQTKPVVVNFFLKIKLFCCSNRWLNSKLYNTNSNHKNNVIKRRLFIVVVMISCLLAAGLFIYLFENNNEEISIYDPHHTSSSTDATHHDDKKFINDILSHSHKVDSINILENNGNSIDSSYSYSYSNSDSASQTNQLQTLTNQFSFFVIGDWGITDRGGRWYPHKKLVADAMSDIYLNKYKNTNIGTQTVDANNDVSFVISVGDQFYDNGISPSYKSDSRSIPNKLFETEFEQIYEYSKLPMPWYLVMGNHDMRGSAQAQIDYSNISQRWKMPNIYYSFDFENIRFIFIDTNSIMCNHDDYRKLDNHEKNQCNEMWFGPRYKSKGNQNNFVQRDVIIDFIKNKIEEVENNSDININGIILVGHHCLYSQGPHGCPNSFRNVMLQSVFSLSNKIVGYFCGHNHAFEHYTFEADNMASNGGGSIDSKEKNKIAQFVVGSGHSLHENEYKSKNKKCVPQNIFDNVKCDVVKVEVGFASVDISSNDVVVTFWNENKEQIYQTNLTLST